jgi:hypothetical protein
MEITINNLNQAIAALRQCAKENKGRTTDTGNIRVSELCNDVATYLEKEWESIKQASEELEKYGKQYKTE